MKLHSAFLCLVLLAAIPWQATAVELMVDGELVRPEDALPCRLEAGDQPGIVHTQFGVETHPVCNAYFDRETDTVYVVTGEPDEAARPAARAIENFMKDHRGIEYFEKIDKSVFDTPPCGWCSWYFYYRNLDEQEAVKNLNWMAENLVPYGAEYFQIDDIWQKHGDEDYRWWRDWTGVYKERFPHGMKWLADRIHDKDMKAGIWLAAFGQTSSEFVKAHPKRWLVDDNGEFVNAGWVGKYLCDTSAEPGQQYMQDLFERLADEWGYDYFKIDGQPPTAATLRKHENSLRNPDMTGNEAYRAGLRAIRKAIGPERYLLGCWGIPLEGIGVMNGSRTGGDVRADWGGFQPAVNCTMRWYFLHNTAWYCDPDTLLVRPPLTLDQARAWASLYGITGQALLSSDRMYTLPEERVEVLRRVFPPLDITPMCLYPYEGRPRIWHLAAQVPGLKRDVIAVFNWQTSPSTAEIDFADIDPRLTADDAPVAVFDFWDDRYLGRFGDNLRLAQSPTSCNVLSATAVAGHPRLISTSRHISQGALELRQVDWEADTNCWSGVSDCVAGDDYTLTFLLDTDRDEVWRIAGANTSGPEATVSNDWPLGRVTFTAPDNMTVTWRVEFAKIDRPAPKLLRAPGNFTAESKRRRQVTLTWDEVPGACGYLLHRDGEPLGTVVGTSYIDRGVAGGASYSYSLGAYGPQGEASTEQAEVSVKTAEPPPKPDVYLTDLEPDSVSEGWGETHFDKSVEGNELNIAGETFDRGIGTHAHSEIVYDIAGKGFNTFVAMVGIDSEISSPQGTCVFQVFADGEKRYDSGVIAADDAAVPASVDVRGIKELKLVVSDGGDNIHYDHADWARAGFLK